MNPDPVDTILFMDGNDWGATASLNGSIQALSETIATQKLQVAELNKQVGDAYFALGEVYGIAVRSGYASIERAIERWAGLNR
jgi:hypothetical protein